jgi:hypothetical protein
MSRLTRNCPLEDEYRDEPLPDTFGNRTVLQRAYGEDLNAMELSNLDWSFGYQPAELVFLRPNGFTGEMITEDIPWNVMSPSLIDNPRDPAFVSETPNVS